MTSQEAGTRPSIAVAKTCVASPMKSVVRSPNRAASQPPTRLVTMPKIS